MKFVDYVSSIFLAIGALLIIIGGLITAFGKAEDVNTARTAQIVTKTAPPGKTTTTGYALMLSGGGLIIVAALMNKDIRDGLANATR